MESQKIGEMVVEFLMKGQDKLDAAYKSAQSGLQQTGTIAAKTTGEIKTASEGISGMAARSFGAVREGAAKALGGVRDFAGQAIAQVRNVSGAALGLASALGAGLGGLVRQGLGGTVEADRLSKVFEILSRVVADSFAPAIRVVTDVIVSVASWLNKLDQGIKSQLALWAAGAVAVTAFVAVLPTIVAGVGAVVTVFGLLISPIGLVVAALGAIAAAFLFAGTQGKSWEETAVTVVSRLITGFEMAKAVIVPAVELIGAAIGTLWGGMLDAAEWVKTNWPTSWSAAGTLVVEAIKWVVGNVLDLAYSMVTSQGRVYQSLIDMTGKFWEALKSKIMGGDFNFDLANEMKAAFAGAFQMVEAPKPDWLKSKFKSLPVAVGELFGQAGDAIGGAWQKGAAGIAAALGNMDAADAKARGFVSLLKGLGQGGGLKLKMDVNFESLQGTFDRLQKAFASDPMRDLGQAQLGELQGINQGIQQVIAGVGKIGGEVK